MPPTCRSTPKPTIGLCPEGITPGGTSPIVSDARVRYEVVFGGVVLPIAPDGDSLC